MPLTPQSTHAQWQKMRIDSLTSLRFFAAAAVLVHHMEFLRTSPSPDVQMVFGWFFEGFAGVQFFYILSGFVIAYSFASRGGTLSFGDFMFFRAARLFPIHWLTLIVATCLYGSLVTDNWGSWLQFLTNGALLQSFIPNQSYYFNYNAVSWSISTEMFFYAAFCLIVPLSNRAILFIWSALMLIILINIVNADMGNSLTGWLLYINPAFRFIDFLTGVLLYRLFIVRPLQLSSRSATLLELASLAAIAGFGVLAMRASIPIQWRWDLFYVPPMALTVFVFAHQQGAISRFLTKRPLVLFGDASFALYMIHQILIAASLKLFDPADIDRIRYMLVAACLLLAAGVTLSVVTHLCFEMPINKALRRWWISRKVKTAGDLLVPPAITSAPA